MKILDAGHMYELDYLDGKHTGILTFVKREGDNYPFNSGSFSGTNVQEVLRALIDRTQYLNAQKPCAETEAALGCLKTALLLYELRAARIHKRTLDLHDCHELMYQKTCDKCNHIGCIGICK